MRRGEVWWADLPERCVVNLDDILTIPRSCLKESLPALSPRKVDAVPCAISFALGL